MMMGLLFSQLPRISTIAAPKRQGTNIFLALLLALLLFFVYQINFRFADSADTIPNTIMPASIIEEGTFNLDRSRSMLVANDNVFDICFVFFRSIQESNNHLVSTYPPGAALMAVPFFAVAKYIGHLEYFYQYRITGKIAASAMTALAAMFVFLALAVRIETRTAWMMAFFFGLGTSAWSISSQALWQHGPGSLCLAIAVYTLCLMELRPTQHLAFLAGSFLGMAIICRMLNAFFVAPLALYILIHHRKYFLACLIPLATLFLLLVHYNYSTFDNITGGYAALFSSKIHAWRNAKPSQLFTHPLFRGLADIYISPSRGLLIYTPFLTPGLIASCCMLFRPQSRLDRYLALWVLLASILLAKNLTWWGGATYGPRYFSETCVALTLLAGAAWPTIKRHRILLVSFILSGAISIVIHGIGAFFAPCGWEITPVPNDFKPERHWDWRDPEIARCAGYGWRNGFKPPEILYILLSKDRG